MIHRTCQNNWNQERSHFRMCTKPSQRNGQCKKKSCAQENTSFMKQIKSLQDAIKTKDMGEMTVVQGLLDFANSNKEAERKKL